MKTRERAVEDRDIEREKEKRVADIIQKRHRKMRQAEEENAGAFLALNPERPREEEMARDACRAG